MPCYGYISIYREFCGLCLGIWYNIMTRLDTCAAYYRGCQSYDYVCLVICISGQGALTPAKMTGISATILPEATAAATVGFCWPDSAQFPWGVVSRAVLTRGLLTSEAGSRRGLINIGFFFCQNVEVVGNTQVLCCENTMNLKAGQAQGPTRTSKKIQMRQATWWLRAFLFLLTFQIFHNAFLLRMSPVKTAALTAVAFLAKITMIPRLYKMRFFWQNTSKHQTQLHKSHTDSNYIARMICWLQGFDRVHISPSVYIYAYVILVPASP